MLEFALLSPVLAVLLAGFTAVSLTFVRTLQADQLCAQAAQMASTGVDFDPEQLYRAYGGDALRERRGALYLTHIMRDAGGYRKDKSYEAGNTARWPASPESSYEKTIQLEPGEDAWVAELWLENETLLSSVTPDQLHAKVVR
jgi:hypothetical protein